MRASGRAGDRLGTISAMAYTQWLRFMFVFGPREVAAGTAEIPAASAVGTQAMREFDTWPDASGLTSLLIDRDNLVRRRP